MFDEEPLHEWLHGQARTILDRYAVSDGAPARLLAVEEDSVELDLIELGMEWLDRSGLERENGWDVDESNEAVAQVLDVAQAVTRETIARRWPDPR